MLTILALRRIPSLLLLYKLIPEVANWREALFCGHFGPIGVGAVFIATLAQSRLEAPHDPPQTQEDLLATALQPIVAFVVLGSILTHGLSIPFFSVGRHTLTISRSVVDQPDWLLWVRRAPPQMDPQRTAVSEGADDTIVSREGPRREGQKRVEWPDELEQTEHEDVKTPSTVAKINGEGPSVTPDSEPSSEQTTIVIEDRIQIDQNDQLLQS